MKGDTWDIKRLKIILEDAIHDCRADGCYVQGIMFEIFDNDMFSIYVNEEKWIENIPIKDAVRIKDFLNYALKDVEKSE